MMKKLFRADSSTLILLRATTFLSGALFASSCAAPPAQSQNTVSENTNSTTNTSATNASKTVATAFPFVIPWDDSRKTPIDVSFLNHKPAGKNGFIVARNSHLIESKTGNRVRFVGAVMTFSSPFPAHAEAEKLAARLAKYGFNAVRMHYIDMPQYGKSSIWDASKRDFRHLDPQQRDRFDYFIAQLKKNGIYTNINLKVARRFMPQDGFPSTVNQLPWGTKRADYFNRRMIALQKEYARDLLGRVNPYTQTRYADEPAILNIEINNENSLSEGDEGEALLGFPKPFRGELQTLWNNWLSKKYSSTRNLRASWNAGTQKLGGEVLRAPSQADNWAFEASGGAQAKLAPQDDALRIDVAQAGTQGWHVQPKQSGLTLQNDQTYTLRFEARADAPRAMAVSASRDMEDWRNMGLSATANLDSTWKTFNYTFTARDALPQHARITFEMGTQTGTVWLRNISLRSGASLPPVADGALEAGKVALPSTRIGRVRSDWLSFLVATEMNYAREMRDFLKNDLRIRSLVINTQHSYGVFTAPYRERMMDYVDMHAYWDHPQAAPDKWDPVGNGLFNKPMTPVLGQNDVLTGAAKYRVVDKPFIVSEYNHPAPNEYASETLPLLASIAARQDWDAIYLHEYGDYGFEADTAKIQAYFAVGSDPNKMAFYPAAALIFRLAQIAPATSRAVATLPPVFTNTGTQSHSVESAWARQGAKAATRATILNQRMALSFGAASAEKAQSSSGASSTLRLEGEESTRVFIADSSRAKILAGYVANRSVALDGAKFSFGALPNNFASLMLSSADNKPLSSSGKIILTTLARAQNTDLKWNADKTALTSWGKAPVLVDGVTARIELQTDGARRVFALDETGAKKRQLPATYANRVLEFAIDSTQKAVWYSIEK